MAAVDEESLQVAQSMWELPTAVHICSVLGRAFGGNSSTNPRTLPKVTITLVEQAIATPPHPLGLDGPALETLIDLMIRLLRGVLDDNSISESDWESRLRQLISERYPEVPNPLEDTEFRWLSVTDKIILLKLLVDWRIEEANDMQQGGLAHQYVNQIVPDDLRLNPLGIDKDGNTYWYFDGVRLYTESPAPRPKKAQKKKKKTSRRQQGAEDEQKTLEDIARTEHIQWQLCCNTLEDWQALVKKLKCKGKSAAAMLYHTVKDDFLPEIESIAEEEERQRRREELMALPRRKSSRQVTLKEKREQEEELRAIRERERQEAEERRQREREEAALQKAEQEREERARQRQEAREARIARREHLKENNVDISWYKPCKKIMAVMKRHKDSWPFHEPVDVSIAPMYDEIVKRPTDMSTIKEHFDDYVYEDLPEFTEEVYRMFDNCRMYNDKETIFFEMANTLEALFESEMTAWFPEWVSRSASKKVEEAAEPAQAQTQGAELPSGDRQVQSLGNESEPTAANPSQEAANGQQPESLRPEKRKADQLDSATDYQDSGRRKLAKTHEEEGNNVFTSLLSAASSTSASAVAASDVAQQPSAAQRPLPLYQPADLQPHEHQKVQMTEQKSQASSQQQCANSAADGTPTVHVLPHHGSLKLKADASADVRNGSDALNHDLQPRAVPLNTKPSDSSHSALPVSSSNQQQIKPSTQRLAAQPSSNGHANNQSRPFLLQQQQPPASLEHIQQKPAHSPLGTTASPSKTATSDAQAPVTKAQGSAPELDTPHQTKDSLL